MKLLVKTFHGLERVLAKELDEMGAENIELGTRAVRFDGSKELLYRANYELRTAVRILQPFHSFKTKHENHLYKKIWAVDWTKYIAPGQTFAINGVTQSRYITHSKYLALKTKDAIVDQFRDRFGARPDVDTINPDVRINVHLGYDNMLTLSLDASGDSLHRRGYRTEQLEAPINEILAAGMVQLSGWQRDCTFIDPMCGSGTIPIEAAMWACNIPAQLHRKTKFAFEKWADFDRALFARIKEEAKAKIIEFEHPIMGFDKDFQALSISRTNAMAAEVDDIISIERSDFFRLEPTDDRGIIIANPPYDDRLEVADISAFYKEIGDRLKQNWKGWSAWLISSNVTALKQLGLRPSQKLTLFNGGTECRFLKYEMYAGTKKIRPNKEVAKEEEE